METTELYIKKHRFDDVKKLALAPCPPDVDLAFALSQIAGRQAIKDKIPSWYETDYIVYPKHLSIEQCSSEATAKYKASLIQGESLVDLTGGFGVDCAFLASRFQSVFYVECQNELCEIAQKNFETLGLNHIQVVCADSTAYLDQIEKVDCIYIDPARRSMSGEKVVTIQDCEPNIISIKEKLMSKADHVMIKLSPMLDISLALQSLSETTEIHVVSVNGECKELLFVLKRCHSERSEESPQIHCVNILKNGSMQSFSFLKPEEQPCIINYTSEPKNYIYEPNSSIMKAGAYKSVASRYNLLKLHPDSHLYTSSEYIKSFPGRAFKVVSVFSLNKKEVKENLHGIEQANISIRNFPGTVDELRKKLRLKDGGDTYLFATTLSNGKHSIILSRKA